MRVYKKCFCLVAFAALAVLAGASNVARADGLVANWMLGEPSGSTSFADASGNGNTGTLVGTDSVVSMTGGAYPASPVGTGIYFNGLSGEDNYINVPYNPALSPTADLTLSAWVYIPNALTGAAPKESIFGIWNPSNNNSQNAPGGNECYQFGLSLNASLLEFRDAGGAAGDQYFGDLYTSATYPNHKYTQGQWMLLTAVFDQGPVGQSVNYLTVYENGEVWHSGEYNVSFPAPGPIPLLPAQSAQPLQLAGGANGTATGNEWLGGLSDLGIWNVALTGPGPIQSGMAYTTLGGETGALYTTPTSGIAALSQYGVKAMNQLFTLYDGQLTAPAGVTTGNGTLGWKYVASGLPGTSGYAGQIAAGEYYVQLDANGGGVETLLPGDANGDGKVDINDLTIVLAHYDQSGTGWAQGEFTGDGKVDINDLTIVLAHYNQSFGSSAGGMSAVPEPGALAALAAGLLGFLAYAWRKRP
jgi:hypothetical protein